jgi:hypothetical protein
MHGRCEGLKGPCATPILSILVLVFAATPATPIIFRHDKDPVEFERLAVDYADPLVWVRFQDSTGLVVAEGTLVAAQWVLTAAHVVAEMKPGASVSYGSENYEVARIFEHPEWTGQIEQLHDIALLKLRRAVANPKPANLYFRDDEKDKEIVLVGRGMTGTGLTGPKNDDRRLRAATNRVMEVGTKYISFSFDSPDSESCTSLEGISGPGDSGGPALLIEQGRLFVVGVSSAQDDESTQGREGHYGVREYYTRVSAFTKWIEETMRENTTGDGR